jgi:hypothetical protein
MITPPGVNPTKLSLSNFFAIKLDHFLVNALFISATKTQALKYENQKMKKNKVW